MNIKKQLQTNIEFRKILKKQKIGWRHFVKYHDFGLGEPIIGSTLREAVCLQKWNGIYDYLICFVIVDNTGKIIAIEK